MEGHRKIIFNKARIRALSARGGKSVLAETIEFVAAFDQLAAAALGHKPSFYEENGSAVMNIKRIELDNQYFKARLALTPPQQGDLFEGTPVGQITLQPIVVNDFKVTRKDTGFQVTFKSRVDGAGELALSFYRGVGTKDISVEIDRATEAEEERGREEYAAQMSIDDADSDGEDSGDGDGDGESESSGGLSASDDTPIDMGRDPDAGSVRDEDTLLPIRQEDNPPASATDAAPAVSEAETIIITVSQAPAANPVASGNFPEPNENGIFSLDQAETKAVDLKNCQARIYVLETGEGFHSTFEVSFSNGNKAVHHPLITIGTGRPSENQAWQEGARALFEFCGNIIDLAEKKADAKVTPRQVTNCRVLRDWASELMEKQPPLKLKDVSVGA